MERFVVSHIVQKNTFYVNMINGRTLLLLDASALQQMNIEDFDHIKVHFICKSNLKLLSVSLKIPLPDHHCRRSQTLQNRTRSIQTFHLTAAPLSGHPFQVFSRLHGSNVRAHQTHRTLDTHAYPARTTATAKPLAQIARMATASATAAMASHRLREHAKTVQGPERFATATAQSIVRIAMARSPLRLYSAVRMFVAAVVLSRTVDVALFAGR